ncbi:MAG: restriction endonuclease subunit S [Spirosomaceae bacterium]|nr:restriction endonuclease subunit S [Spirosomataceae bacterium]
MEKRLNEIGCSFLSGFAFKSSDYSSIGIPLIKIGNIQDRIVTVDTRGDYVSEELINDKTIKFLLNNGDILIAMTGQGSVGRVGKLKLRNNERAFLNQRVGKFLCDEVRINKDYLYYILTTDKYQDYLFNTGAGSGQPNLSPELILQTEIPWVEYNEQTAIASVLSSLDDKIDLLHRQNATLEKMAETLFRQWFVEEAKEGWEMGKLGDEFDFVMGASPPGESYNEEGNGVPMYQGNADFGFRFPTNRVFTTDPKRFAEKFDTLISVRAPVGEQNMANERCCIGRGVAAFRFKIDNSFYTYTYYKMKSLMNDIKQFNETGTVFGSISKSDFESIDAIIPDLETINRFQTEVKPIDDKVITNTTQIRTLTALRDTLLPKLMSGEIKVNL